MYRKETSSLKVIQILENIRNKRKKFDFNTVNRPHIFWNCLLVKLKKKKKNRKTLSENKNAKLQ